MVSIYEARTSKIMGMSMKRLSWITVSFRVNLVRSLMLMRSIVYLLTTDVCRGNDTLITLDNLFFSPLMLICTFSVSLWDEHRSNHQWPALVVGYCARCGGICSGYFRLELVEDYSGQYPTQMRCAM